MERPWWRRNVAPVSEVDYQPYVAGAFRWRLGLRPLDTAHWIELGPDADAALARKHEVLAAHAGTALGWVDGVEDDAAEVLDELTAHLTRTFGSRYGDDPAGLRRASLAASPTGHPLEAAGRLVPEDLVLLVERDGRLVVGGGSVCFPNRWDLRSKLGAPLAEVHAPVPRLNDQLGDPIERVLERLTPERSFWRLGWGVLDTAELYQPLDGTAAPRPARPGPHDVHLRVERETLRRFPRTRCVLFTIRTYVTPLTSLAARPDDADRLAAAVEALPGDVARYKQLDELGPAVVTWLRRPPEVDTSRVNFLGTG